MRTLAGGNAGERRTETTRGIVEERQQDTGFVGLDFLDNLFKQTSVTLRLRHPPRISRGEGEEW